MMLMKAQIVLAHPEGKSFNGQLSAITEKVLGDDFDLRGFHDHLLAAGALPLNILESRMNDWMERQKNEN